MSQSHASSKCQGQSPGKPTASEDDNLNGDDKGGTCTLALKLLLTDRFIFEDANASLHLGNDPEEGGDDHYNPLSRSSRLGGRGRLPPPPYVLVPVPKRVTASCNSVVASLAEPQRIGPPTAAKRKPVAEADGDVGALGT